MRPQLVVYLEPFYKSKFYNSLEKYLLASLSYYGLHEGAMFPPHCDMTAVIAKGNEQSAEDVGHLLDVAVKKFAPYNRPIVKKPTPVDLTSARDGFLGIPLTLTYSNCGVKTNRYEYCVREFRYEMDKQHKMEVYPTNLEHTYIPLAYNNDHFLTKDKKLSMKELVGMHDLALEIVDFKDSETCAWFITLHQLRPSIYPNHPHMFDPPVQTWEICPEVLPTKKWNMDWPVT
ncbi:unnamed protein product [Calypogeia fissa]